MKNLKKTIFALFIVFALITGINFASAAIGYAEWIVNGNYAGYTLTIANGQTATFEYDVQAVTSHNGHYSINLFRQNAVGAWDNIYTYANNVATINNGATGTFNTFYGGIPGNYVIRVDSYDDYGADSYPIYLTVNPATALAAVCNAAPATGAAPLNVLFAGTAAGGSGTYAYAWNFNDGTNGNGAAIAHTYNTAGVYNSILTVTDGTGAIATANCPAITVTGGAIHTLTAAFTFVPLAPVVNEVITFDGSASVDSLGHTLTYTWNFGDGTIQSSGNNPIITHSYNAPGTYPVTLTVADGFGLTDSVTHNVVVTGILNITSINCFRTVIEGQNQSCQITVETNNLPAQNVNVDVYFLDGTPFGSCVTSISGACTVDRTMNTIGTYTVYATAIAPGYINDIDTYPRYTFDVIGRQYDIVNLATYNDSAFLNHDSVFYRGEALYVKFQVYDVVNHVFITDDIVTAASLVSLPGGRADLTEMSFNDNWYYYRLNMIPLTHDFLGGSNVFAFAFNFTGNVGGQAQVALTILNNAPMISPIADVNINVGQAYNLDLTPYAYDLEDHRNLRWTVAENSAYFDAQITNLGYSNLQINGLSVGSGILTLRAYDLDNDYAETTVRVNVGIGSGNTTLTAEANGPYNGFVNEPLTFDASGSTGAIVRYHWDFGDGNSADTTLPTFAYTYVNKIGRYIITLTVYDAQGNSATDTTTATILDRVPAQITPVEDEEEGSLYIGRILIYGESGDEILKSNDAVTVTVNMENNYNSKLEDVRMTIEIPELAIKQKTASFDLKKGQEATKSLTMDLYDVPAGYYYMKIMINNDDVKRTLFREIIVK